MVLTVHALAGAVAEGIPVLPDRGGVLRDLVPPRGICRVAGQPQSQVCPAPLGEKREEPLRRDDARVQPLLGKQPQQAAPCSSVLLSRKATEMQREDLGGLRAIAEPLLRAVPVGLHVVGAHGLVVLCVALLVLLGTKLGGDVHSLYGTEACRHGADEVGAGNLAWLQPVSIVVIGDDAIGGTDREEEVSPCPYGWRKLAGQFLAVMLDKVPGNQWERHAPRGVRWPLSEGSGHVRACVGDRTLTVQSGIGSIDALGHLAVTELIPRVLCIHDHLQEVHVEVFHVEVEDGLLRRHSGIRHPSLALVTLRAIRRD
mmetsp:Transcript_33858/g.79147  ORF Transcript_33858/g.79147 Transcript_33858/m.79147 type:complete len:314 (+) Transcript_33858:590-1531(+)